MLKGIDPLLSADLLWILAAMGHGDDLAIVDANHPAEKVARATVSAKLVRLPGHALEAVVSAVLSVLPVDTFEPNPIRCMEVVGDASQIPPVRIKVHSVIEEIIGKIELKAVERFAFYEAAKASFAVIQVGDIRPYGCFLIRKGVINDLK